MEFDTNFIKLPRPFEYVVYDCEIYTNQVIEEQDENEEEFSDNEKNILIYSLRREL